MRKGAFGGPRAPFAPRASLRAHVYCLGVDVRVSCNPQTIENFCTHSRNGYYDGVIFHRVIKGFMVQTVSQPRIGRINGGTTLNVSICPPSCAEET